MINKILDSKLFYMILALLAAVILWLYVTDESDDSRLSLTLPITYVGEESLQARGLMLDKTGNETIYLTFQGRRSVIMQLSAANVRVQADVSGIVSTGVQAIRCSVVYPSSIPNNSVSVEQISLDIDLKVVRMTTKTVEVKGIFSGSLAEGYWADEVLCSPNVIEISGEAELLERVDHAEVVIDRKDVSASINENMTPTLVDKEGSVIDSTNIQLGQETVLVTMLAGYIREIPLNVEFISGGGATSSNATFEIEPKSVILAGDKAQLDAYNSITLDPIDLSQVVSTAAFERNIPISSDLINLSGLTTATVSVTVNGLDTRTMTVSSDGIQYINKPEDCTVEAVSQSVPIRIRGPEASLDLVMESNIRVVANLEDISASAGTYRVPVTVYVDGFDDVGAVGEHTIIVSVRR